ncbi:hypothetical protein BV20DRAFT_947649 [Pilatotrama ljubarskyi]|nr:hypothetical protein BV20DRAFT_947649 [Pilatotrama ljubarskyi]
MAQLRAFLDAATLHENSRRYTVREIRHHYLTWKREGVLHHFGPHHLSSLISLLGSLSIASPGKRPDALHTHGRLSDMSEIDYAPHWDLVLGMCGDKRRLRYPLSTSDIYWLMRAGIARFWEHTESNKADAEQYLVAARRCYDSICDTSPHLNLHLPYFQALLADPSTEHLHLFATRMAAILMQDGRLDPSLLRFFFATIVSQTGFASFSKRAVLCAISERISGRDLEHGSSSQTGMCAGGSDESFPGADIPSLVATLEHALFNRNDIHQCTSNATSSEVAEWARVVAHRVFWVSRDEDATVDLRWKCLVLLALVRTRSSEWNGASTETWSDPVVRAAVMEWQAVCILAAMDNLFGPAFTSGDDPLSAEVAQGFCGVLRKLWNDWTAIPPSAAPPRPLYVARLICASFFRLAGHLGDRVLVDTCREHCVSVGLWAPGTAAGLQALATEQLYAALKCGTFFERALVDLVVCTTDMDVLRGAADAVIMRYARFDPEQAQELLAWASHRGIAPSGRAIAGVGISLAEHGVNSYMDRYIDHPSLTADQRAEVVIAYLRMFVEHGRRFMDPRAIVATSPKVMDLSTQVTDPKLLLEQLHSTLRVLIREGYGGQAATLFEGVMAKHSSGASRATVSQLLHALLRHRRFELAQRVLTISARTYPDMTSRWATLIYIHASRGGASQLASRLATSNAVNRPFPSDPATGNGEQELESPTEVTRDRPSSLQRLQSLVRGDRLHAAKKLYERLCQQESPEIRTAAGNMLILGTASRASHGQRVGATVYAYKTLKEKHGFVPDRVTVNIMFKVLLGSKDMDAQKARGLLDAVVRMGYPGRIAPQGDTEGDAESALPFGIAPAVSPALGDVEIPRLASPIMYMRHVRPLYKTFIKAFHRLGDVEAAWKVVGIIKALEAQNSRRVVDGRDWVVGQDGREDSEQR